MISFKVEDEEGVRRTIEVPEDISLSVMEVLRASEYPIPATCGGLALCATCHVEIVEGVDQLGPPTPAELDMLDTLPSTSSASRLSCQIRLHPGLQDVVLKLKSSA